MTVTTGRPGPSRAATSRIRLRLGWRWHKATLIVHILSAGTWIGVDVLVAVFVLIGQYGGTVELRSLAYRALATFVVWPMFVAGLTCLASGLVLGLGTKWGLVRYWWVATKLTLNLVLCTLIVVLLQPGMDNVSRYGADLLTGTADQAAVSTLFFPPAVSLSALTLATILSVVKPWGRLRLRRGNDNPR